MSKSVDTIVKEFVKGYMDKEEKKIDESIKETSRVMLEEINKMYRHYIDDFYSSFTTTSYIRHGTSRPGTQTGYALYRANRSYVKGSKHPVVCVDIAGSNMQEIYRYNTADEVFDYVADDIRFTAGGISKGYKKPKRKGQAWEWTLSWHISKAYSSRYFDFDCSIAEAFAGLQANWDRYARYIFDDIYKP